MGRARKAAAKQLCKIGLEEESKLKAWNGFGHCRSGSKLHTQGGPGRRPALARARQGRRIFIKLLTTWFLLRMVLSNYRL